MTNKSSSSQITKKSFQKSMEEMLVKEYEDTYSPTFGKNSQTVKRVVLRKYPKFKGHLTDKFTRDTLNRLSTTYSTTRTLRRNKHFHGTSFYSTHPCYHWHVDLQDMSIFRQTANLRRQDANNFLLVCVDDAISVTTMMTSPLATVASAVITMTMIATNPIATMMPT